MSLEISGPWLVTFSLIGLGLTIGLYAISTALTAIHSTLIRIAVATEAQRAMKPEVGK